MSESLKVKNFLVIKHAEVELKKINVIIGPQANGKSLIAKLISFFNSLSDEFIEGVRANESKRVLDKNIISKFEDRFPRYSWDGTSFSIEYKIDSLNFLISGRKNSKNKTLITLEYSKNLVNKFKAKKSLFKRKVQEEKENRKNTPRIRSVERQVLREHVGDPLKELYPCFFSDSFFIPASRSFFANLQKNIFTFLASNLDIDPYLKEFGQVYENSKFWYKDGLMLRHNKTLVSELYKLIESIVQGEYEYHDDQDWLISKGRKINLANASSGQQESLPMLLVLAVWPILSESGNGVYFIEEPEAHLFPTSQGHIISILSMLHEALGTKFFITTHSPYILSALNNFILAGDTLDKEEITIEEFREINGSGSPIRFDDVSAYTIINGRTESIADSEYRMIGGDILDNISEHFEEVMNELLSCGKG
ncbi:AAA family ATPase [Bacterioplanoides sp. SCSIO 12839]|uniref:AAA family ATPase n=1 Tax=Bacterioplanoides sp. SCSIO 12839 TaxID=2829569 RepID=UPI002107ADE9|nr:AAA family ATPase [Bacterioplanoides sp. SCSIO 12839]UTW46904.1 AAA family ATPase [Bacterioplanoides sp. SCSIO 12839]